MPKGFAERLAGMSRWRPDDSPGLWPWSTIHKHDPSPHSCAAKAEHTANHQLALCRTHHAWLLWLTLPHKAWPKVPVGYVSLAWSVASMRDCIWGMIKGRRLVRTPALPW